MVPTRSLEEESVIWFRDQTPIYQPARLAFFGKSKTL